MLRKLFLFRYVTHSRYSRIETLEGIMIKLINRSIIAVCIYVSVRRLRLPLPFR
jgi:hypothetical protein